MGMTDTTQPQFGNFPSRPAGSHKPPVRILQLIRRMWLLSGLVFAAIPIAWVVCDVGAATPGGSAVEALGTIVLASLGMICLASPLIGLALVVRGTPRSALAVVVGAILYFELYKAADRVIEAARRSRLEAWTRRTQPLIDAIEAYQRDHGSPPQRLADLAPGYLASVPPAGTRFRPTLWYFVDDKDESVPRGWRVIAWFPRNVVDADVLSYRPGAATTDEPGRKYKGRFDTGWDWEYVTD